MKKLNAFVKVIFLISIYSVTYFSEKLSWGFKSEIFYIVLMLIIGLAFSGVIYKALSVIVILISFSYLVLRIEIAIVKPLWYLMVLCVTLGTVYEILRGGQIDVEE